MRDVSGRAPGQFVGGGKGAVKKGEVVKAVQARSGVLLEIISGEQEAHLAYLAAVAGVGEVAAVASAPAPGPGEQVRLAVDVARVAVIPVD